MNNLDLEVLEQMMQRVPFFLLSGMIHLSKKKKKKKRKEKRK